jgi:hypothetical protein
VAGRLPEQKEAALKPHRAALQNRRKVKQATQPLDNATVLKRCGAGDIIRTK